MILTTALRAARNISMNTLASMNYISAAETAENPPEIPY
jgi:hypothetical protein